MPHPKFGRTDFAARRRIGDSLSTEQRSKFDQAMIDPMLGGGMGSGPVSFSVFSTTDESTMK